MLSKYVTFLLPNIFDKGNYRSLSNALRKIYYSFVSLFDFALDALQIIVSTIT